MNPLFVQAIDEKLKWLRWLYSNDSRDMFADSSLRIGGTRSRGTGEGRVTHSLYRHVLERSETFVMVPEFCSLVEHARAAVPLSLEFDPLWLQAKCGWLWMADPPPLPKIVGQKWLAEREKALGERAMPEIEVYLRAVGWVPISPGTGVRNARGVLDAGENWFSVCMFVTAASPDGTAAKEYFLPWSHPVLRPAVSLAQRIEEFEDDAEAKADGGTYWETRPSANHELAWFYVAQHLMAQKVATTLRVRPDRATRRRAEAQRHPIEEVKVVTLRRLEAARERAGQTENVDWKWHWEVTGHWRSQYYPSENRHKDVWISWYLKGPLDKPRKPATTKIWVARR